MHLSRRALIPRAAHDHPEEQGKVEGDESIVSVRPVPRCSRLHRTRGGSLTHRGLDNAGKTTILKKLNGEDTSGVSPTLGFNIKTLIRDGYTLNICASKDSVILRSNNRLTEKGDVGGQKTLRPYWRNYFESTDAVVWVVDSSDALRMRDCGEELRGLLQEEVG